MIGRPTRTLHVRVVNDRQQLKRSIERHTKLTHDPLPLYITPLWASMRRTRYSLRMSKQNNGSQLPFELLSHIFLLGCPEFSADDNMAEVVDPFPYLVRTSSVCRWWRQVALQTQSLWTTIYFVLRTTPTCRQKYEAILERSGDMNLAVYIAHPSVFHGPQEHMSAKENVPLSLMLKRASIIGVTSGNPKFPELAFSHLPRLQHFIMSSLNFPAVDIFPIPRVLQSVSYITGGPLDTVEQNCVTQSSPRCLSLNVIVLKDDRIEMLETLHHLEELSITYRYKQNSRNLSHRTLTHLTITVRHITPSTILGSLPSLVHLTFCVDAYYPGRKKDHGRDSPCTMSPLTALRTLAVKPRTHLYDYAHHVMTIVDHAPGLVALELWDENALQVVSRLAGLAPEVSCEPTDDSDSASNPYSPEEEPASSTPRSPAPNVPAPAPAPALGSLRLVRIGFAHPDASEWLKPMSAACAKLLERRPDVRIEWRDPNAEPPRVGRGRKKKERGRFDRILAHAPEGVDVSVSKWEGLSGMF